MSGSSLASSSYVVCGQSISSAEAATIRASLLINYGNGTLHWYNQTVVPSSWNAYALTMYVLKCNVQAQYYGPPLNEHLVEGINGVAASGSLTWSIWGFCPSQNAWSYSQVGADLIHLTNGQVLAWVYETSSSSNVDQPPVPGAKTTTACS
jgi:hypothetical protein